MIQKKYITTIIAFLFSLLVLAGCNSEKTEVQQEKQTENETQTEANSEAETKEKVELIISAAASLTDVAEEISTAFNKENEHITVTYNFGSSGSLVSQIQEGAPADIFLSASKKDMDTLADGDLIVADSRFVFAGNSLVVIAPKDSALELSSLDDIATVEAANIIIGDTTTTPIGRYTKESFENINAWSAVEGKLVFATTVNQILTHVQDGNAELGVSFKTDAMRNDEVKALLDIDPSLHGAITYPAAVIKDSQQQEAASLYINFLASEEGKQILASHGFLTK